MDAHRPASSLDAAAKAILQLALPHPCRVAVDGRTASGKTTFADALGATLGHSGRQIIRASIDGFHHPRSVRHRQGRLSPDGYYEDVRDLAAFRGNLLEPLGPGGNRIFATTVFDLARDRAVAPDVQLADKDAVVIVDGTFLQRPELRAAWDFTIFLNVSASEARRRGVERDATALGGSRAASEIYSRRYEPAFARYETECRPAEEANLVIDGVEWG